MEIEKLNKDVRQLYEKALMLFGIGPQRRMMIEEASELIEALVRQDRGRATNEDVITEIADVIIMCEQLCLVYGEKAVQAEITRKRARLADRLKQYE
jgi:NTP pyrophosphatase (non-canonical NTP hydrolase)